MKSHGREHVYLFTVIIILCFGDYTTHPPLKIPQLRQEELIIHFILPQFDEGFRRTGTGDLMHNGESAFTKVMLYVDYDRNYMFTQVGPQNSPPLLPHPSIRPRSREDDNH